MAAFLAGWMTVSVEDNAYDRWTKGDLNLSGFSELEDVVIFQQALASAGLTFPGSGPFAPEPSGLAIVLLFVSVAVTRVRGRR